MKKGVLEMCILKIISQGDLYGYEIMKAVTEAFPEMNESTVYAVLRRLYSDGLTQCYSGSVSGGPTRKYYRITAEGIDELQKMLDEWKSTLNSLKKLGVE